MSGRMMIFIGCIIAILFILDLFPKSSDQADQDIIQTNSVSGHEMAKQKAVPTFKCGKITSLDGKYSSSGLQYLIKDAYIERVRYSKWAYYGSIKGMAKTKSGQCTGSAVLDRQTYAFHDIVVKNKEKCDIVIDSIMVQNGVELEHGKNRKLSYDIVDLLIVFYCSKFFYLDNMIITPHSWLTFFCSWDRFLRGR